MAHLLRILTAALVLTELAAWWNKQCVRYELQTFSKNFFGFCYTRFVSTITAKFTDQFRGVLLAALEVVFQQRDVMEITTGAFVGLFPRSAGVRVHG